jgi:hypothetical protein
LCQLAWTLCSYAAEIAAKENLWLEEVTKAEVAEIWTGQVGSKLPALKYEMHQSI